MEQRRKFKSRPFWTLNGGRGNGRERSPGRGFRFEQIEPRILLSASLDTPGVDTALIDGLDDFGSVVSDFLQHETLLDTELPLLVRRGGDNLLNDFNVAPTIREMLLVDADINGDGYIGGTDNETLNTDEADLYDQIIDLDSDGDYALDFSDIFQEKLVADISAYLHGDDLDGNTIPDQDEYSLQDFLNLPDRHASASYTSSVFANRSFNLEIHSAADISSDSQVGYELDLTLTFTNELGLDLGFNAEELGIVPSTTLDVDASIQFTLSFGVLTSGEEAQPEDFFVAADPVTVSVEASETGLNEELRIGFLGAEIQDGSVFLEAKVIGSVEDPTSASALGFAEDQFGDTREEGTLTALHDAGTYELSEDSEFVLRIGGSDPVSVTVTAEMTTGNSSAADLASSVEEAVSDAGLADLVSVNLVDGRIRLSVADSNLSALGFAVNELTADGSVVTATGTPSLNTPVSFVLSVDHGLPGLVEIAGAATVDGIVSQLNEALDGTGVTATKVIVDTGAGSEERIRLDPGAGYMEVSDDLTLDSKITPSDLQNQPASELITGAPDQVVFDGSDTWIVGKDIKGNLELRIQDHGFTGGEQIVYSRDDGDADIGGLENGSVYYVIYIGSDKIALSKTGRASDRIAFSGTGTGDSHRLVNSRFDVSLPIRVKQGLTGFEPTAVITFDTPTHSPFDLPEPVHKDRDRRFDFGIDLQNISPGFDKQDLLDFTNIDASSVIGLLRGFGRYLDQLGQSDDFAAYDIPFSVADLGDVLDFEDMWTDALLVDDLDNDDSEDDQYRLLDENNNPVFATAQELAERLGELLFPGLTPEQQLAAVNAAYDAGTADLTYNIRIENPLPTLEAPADFNLPIDPLDNVSSDATVLLGGSAGLEMVLGINLGQTPGEYLENSTTLEELDIVLQPDLAVTAETEARTVYGRLSEDATLTVTLKDSRASQYEVLVSADATAENETVADLVQDINAALAQARLVGSGGIQYLDFLGFDRGQSADGALAAARDVSGYSPGMDLTFELTVGGETYVIELPAAGVDGTDGNADIDDLVADLNAALARAKAADGATVNLTDTGTDPTGQVVAGKDGSGARLTITPWKARPQGSRPPLRSTAPRWTLAAILPPRTPVTENVSS